MSHANADSPVPPLRVRITLEAEVHEGTPEEGGYWVSIPNVPGLVTQGETREELEANLREAVEAYFDLPDGSSEVVAPAPSPAASSAS